MIIYCTKKLLDDIQKNQPHTGPVAESGSDSVPDPLFEWHAKLISFNHRKVAILVNGASRFVVCLYGLKAKDFKRFGERAIEGIRATMERCLINPDLIDAYIAELGTVTTAKSKNHQTVAWANAAEQPACFSFDEFYENMLFFEEKAGAGASHNLVSRGKDDPGSYFYPIESMVEELEKRYGSGEPFRFDAVRLRVRMDTDELDISRELIVPRAISMLDLHMILQVAFDWQNYHLNHFMIPNEHKPLLRLVDYEDPFADEDFYPTLRGGLALLADIGQKYSGFDYEYDFGDSWVHRVKIVESIDANIGDQPVCLSGTGDAPPEDVGSWCGFAEFTEIIDSPKHPDHFETLAWAKSVDFQRFEIERINKTLSRMLRTPVRHMF